MPNHSWKHNAAAALAHGVLAYVALANREVAMALSELLLAVMYARLTLKP